MLRKAQQNHCRQKLFDKKQNRQCGTNKYSVDGQMWSWLQSYMRKYLWVPAITNCLEN